MLERTVPFLNLNEALYRLDLRKFFYQNFDFQTLLSFPLSSPDLLELVSCLVRQSFLLGPEERLEKSLLVRDDPALIIDLILVIGEPFPPDSFLLLLDLPGDEVAHVKLRPLLHQSLEGEKQRVQVGELGGQGLVQLACFHYYRLEVYLCSVQNVLNIVGKLGSFPLKFDNIFHF